MNEWTDDSRLLQESNFSRKAATGRHITSYRQLRVKLEVELKAPNNTPQPTIPLNFKQCIQMHKCLNNCMPRYLAESIRSLPDDPSRSRLRLSKSSDVTISRTKAKLGDQIDLLGRWSTCMEQSPCSYSGDPSRFQETVKVLHNSKH